MLYHCRFHSPYSILCSFLFFFFFLMIRRPPRSTLSSSSAASDVYKRQVSTQSTGGCSLVAWGSEQPRSSISMLDRTQVTEIPNKAPPDYAELSALELMTGDLKGMFGSAAGSGMVPEDMQGLGIIGKYAPTTCAQCGGLDVKVVYADFEFKFPNSYEKHTFELECAGCGKFTQRFLEQTESDECTEAWD
eukprot:TRINITY_DN1825_c0_g1_i1.p1 TRINITY_DN1825_c0_g1~~TRINITY_DN1825_c0_g1_i1.p1  ORF type:complete len:190 (-),score=33.98 TRINITY_DN1825_c0_g1_i1:265-834(-)